MMLHNTTGSKSSPSQHLLISGNMDLDLSCLSSIDFNITDDVF